MGILENLGKDALEKVLGNTNKPNTSSGQSKSTAKQNPKSSKGIEDVIKDNLVDMAAKKIKTFTPDSIDKIIDDVTSKQGNKE